MKDRLDVTKTQPVLPALQKLLDLLHKAGATRITPAQETQNLNALFQEVTGLTYIPEKSSYRELDIALPFGMPITKLSETNKPYLEFDPQDLTYVLHYEPYFGHPNVLSVAHKGYPFIYMRITSPHKKALGYMLKDESRIESLARTYMYTNLETLVWSPATQKPIQGEQPYLEYINDVFTVEGLQRIWENKLPDEGYFAFISTGIFTDKDGTPTQISNLLDKSIINLCLGVLTHPNLTENLYLRILEETKGKRSDMFWTNVFWSKYIGKDIILEAVSANAHATQALIDYTTIMKSACLDVIMTVLNDPSLRPWHREKLVEGYYHNPRVRGDIWATAHLKKDEKDFSYLPLGTKVYALTWLISSGNTPVWKKRLIQDILDSDGGHDAIIKLMVTLGLVEPNLESMLPKTILHSYALEML